MSVTPHQRKSPPTVSAVKGAQLRVCTAINVQLGALTQANTGRKPRKTVGEKAHECLLDSRRRLRARLIQALKRWAIHGKPKRAAYFAARAALIAMEKQIQAVRNSR